MYIPVLLTLLCVGIICGQQDIGTDYQETQMHLYCTNRDQRSTQDTQRLRQVMVGKSGPRGPPGIVDYTTINGTIKKYVEELTERTLSEIEHATGGNSEEIQGLAEISRRKLSEIEQVVEGNREGIRNLAELTERKLSEIEQVVEGNSEEIQELAGASDQAQRQVTQCSQDIEALKAGIKNLQTKLMRLIVADLSTWFKATNGNYYKLFNDKVNYATAKANCEKYGARLATAGIRDDDVRRELLPLVKAGGYSTWIGLNDIEEEGTFYWEDAVRADASFTPWVGIQPDNYQGMEDCGEIGSNHDWKFNDINCSALRKYFCEIEI